MTAGDIIIRARRKLDQIPLEVESVTTDSDVVGSISTEFSDEDLLERVNRGVHKVISEVKVQHCPQVIAEKNSVNAIETSALRLLFRRVFASDDGGDSWVRAFRRTVDSQSRMEMRTDQDPREATADFPVYIYEDGTFQIYPRTSDVKAYVVEQPPEASGLPETLVLDGRFERALTDYVVASCYQSMRQSELSEYFSNLFIQSLQPYSLKVRYRRLDDQEVDVE